MFKITAKLESEAPTVEKITRLAQTEEQVQEARDELRADAPLGSTVTIKVTKVK